MSPGAPLRYLVSLVALFGILAAYVRYRDLDGQYAAWQKSAGNVRALRSELEAARKREAELKRNVFNLEEEPDPLEWEAAIRLNTGRLKPGEKNYRVELGGID